MTNHQFSLQISAQTGMYLKQVLDDSIEILAEAQRLEHTDAPSPHPRSSTLPLTCQSRILSEKKPIQCRLHPQENFWIGTLPLHETSDRVA